MTGEPGAAGVFQTFRELPLAARFVLLGVFINQFGAFLQVFMVLYLVDRGFTGGEAGIALGAYSIGAIVGVLFGGGLTDRLGPRWTIVLSVGSAALFTLVVTFVDGLPAIVVAVALAGAMTQAARPAATSLLLGYVPKARQVMTFALYRTALHTGSVAGPLVASWLSTIDWDLVFYLDAVTALAYAAIAVFMLAPAKAPAPVTADPASDTAASDTAAKPASRSGYQLILRDRRYLTYLALMFMNGFVHIQLIAVLPLMMLAADYPTWAYGTAASVAAFAVIAGELPVVKVTQSWAPWAAVIIGWVLLVVGRGALGLPGGITVVLIAVVIASLGQCIGGAQAMSYPMKVAPAHASGRYIGSALATFQLGYAVGPIVGIALWTQLGRSFWLLVIVIGLAMVLPGIWSMRPPAPPAEATTTDADTTEPVAPEAAADTTTTAPTTTTNTAEPTGRA